jgi:hypothetical protein
VQGGQLASKSQFEERAVPVFAAEPSGSIEVAVSALDQRPARLRAVGAVRQGAETVEGGCFSRRRDFENESILFISPGNRHVEVAIARLNYTGRILDDKLRVSVERGELTPGVSRKKVLEVDP